MNNPVIVVKPKIQTARSTLKERHPFIKPIFTVSPHPPMQNGMHTRMHICMHAHTHALKLSAPSLRGMQAAWQPCSKTEMKPEMELAGLYRVPCQRQFMIPLNSCAITNPALICGAPAPKGLRQYRHTTLPHPEH